MFVARSIAKAVLFNSEGDARRAYEALALARPRASSSEDVSYDFLYTLIYSQGVTALRLGENDIEKVHATMGSNYGDFDNDGFLDFYLGTGEPSFATLVPNRMFRNVAGKRFAEITGTSRTGHLQKGHGVAIGDYDRDGDVDIFIETGGAVHGDMYHMSSSGTPARGTAR